MLWLGNLYYTFGTLFGNYYQETLNYLYLCPLILFQGTYPKAADFKICSLQSSKSSRVVYGACSYKQENLTLTVLSKKEMPWESSEAHRINEKLENQHENMQETRIPEG
jgi:hypothetical protein